MTTFTAIDGSTVTPITRADLMKHPAFAGLNVDSEGNPCVWMNFYVCPDCPTFGDAWADSWQNDPSCHWSDDWSCGCEDDCPNCGKSRSPHDQQWLPACEVHGPDYCLWEALPEAGSPEADKAQEDAAMAEHADYVERRETATILAALRFWQRIGLRHVWAVDSPDHGYLAGQSTHPEGAISTDGGTIPPMTAEDIDRLIDRINEAPVDF